MFLHLILDPGSNSSYLTVKLAIDLSRGEGNSVLPGLLLRLGLGRGWGRGRASSSRRAVGLSERAL